MLKVAPEYAKYMETSLGTLFLRVWRGTEHVDLKVCSLLDALRLSLTREVLTTEDIRVLSSGLQTVLDKVMEENKRGDKGLCDVLGMLIVILVAASPPSSDPLLGNARSTLGISAEFVPLLNARRAECIELRYRAVRNLMTMSRGIPLLAMPADLGDKLAVLLDEISSCSNSAIRFEAYVKARQAIVTNGLANDHLCAELLDVLRRDVVLKEPLFLVNKAGL